MQIGAFDVAILTEGSMRIDGGAVFGPVPRALWEKKLPPDEKNRVQIGLNQLLVRGPEFNLLIDTGVGTKVSPKYKNIYGIETKNSWDERLKPFGLTPGDITHIIFTHLHFDHSGGATCFSDDANEVFPTFPNAKHFVQEGEWRDACSPNERTRRQYLFENFLPLQNEGKLQLISGDHEIVEGVRVHVTGGHTRYHQMVVIGSGVSRLFVPGDLCPTAQHLGVAWQMAFDLFPLDCLQARKGFLAKVLNTSHLVYFNHDPEARFVKIQGDSEHPEAIPAD